MAKEDYYSILGVARDAKADGRHHGEQKKELPHFRNPLLPAYPTTRLLKTPLTPYDTARLLPPG